MPEGDTIYRAARTMREALVGRAVTAVETTVPQVVALAPSRLVGQVVRAVEPRGKHLLHWFDPSGLALHTHMRMTGSWHVYRAGERWLKPRRWARFVMEAGEVTAVCFSAPVCELLSRGQVDRHPRLATLGPDALAATVDLGEARRRLDARGGALVGEALLDQRVLAGIGNVYKNEVLFIHRVDPWSTVEEVPAGARDDLLATAARLLRANVSPGALRRVTTGATAAAAGGGRPARTTAASAYHVYGRAGRPCGRCGARIRVATQGERARLTYWCSVCQGPGPARRPPRRS